MQWFPVDGPIEVEAETVATSDEFSDESTDSTYFDYCPRCNELGWVNRSGKCPRCVKCGYREC
jgi:hypothetical protein